MRIETSPTSDLMAFWSPGHLHSSLKHSLLIFTKYTPVIFWAFVTFANCAPQLSWRSLNFLNPVLLRLLCSHEVMTHYTPEISHDSVAPIIFCFRDFLRSLDFCTSLTLELIKQRCYLGPQESSAHFTPALPQYLHSLNICTPASIVLACNLLTCKCPAFSKASTCSRQDTSQV